jgi:hypothetical protein
MSLKINLCHLTERKEYVCVCFYFNSLNTYIVESFDIDRSSKMCHFRVIENSRESEISMKDMYSNHQYNLFICFLGQTMSYVHMDSTKTVNVACGCP